MVAPAGSLARLNKVVVAYLDGRRLKGFVYDFSAAKDFLNLLPQEDALHAHGSRIDMKDLKAVFFVKDFAGDPQYHEDSSADSPMHGRKIEVAFHDGEIIHGKTEGYNPQKIGFFLFPGDPRSNNIRIFVITANARQVKFS